MTSVLILCLIWAVWAEAVLITSKRMFRAKLIRFICKYFVFFVADLDQAVLAVYLYGLCGLQFET